MSRRYLIVASVAAHAAVAVGLFVSGIWRIEKLDYQHRARLTLGAMMPLGDSGGGEGEKKEAEPEKKKEVKKKEHRKVIKDELRQVEKLERAPLEDTSEATGGGGGGEGDGEGPDVGPATGGGGGTCDPLADPDRCGGPPVVAQATCGDGFRAASEQCDDGNLVNGDRCSATCKVEQIVLPPAIFQGLRISGETQIVPPDTVKTQMLREGKERTVGAFKMCIDAGGRISSIAPVARGTGYPGYDAKLTSTMRTWRYQPYMADKTPMPVCSVVTFVYTIK